MEETLIEINDLQKIYKMGKEKVAALKGINLKIEAGDFCSILGKSGSGKSTLLNMLAGLEKPTKGQVVINGRHLEKMNENQVTIFRKKYIGFIFQSYNLLPTHTALENVMLPTIFNNVPRKERLERAKEILAAVGLEDRFGHKPSQMSGGQQQRVSIARAFVSRPKIILADEPTGNLDSKTEAEIMELILKMKEQYNQTLVMVTHEEDTAKYANKIITVKDGLVINEKINGGSNQNETVR